MLESRHQFREDLIELERQTLDALNMVSGALDHALDAIIRHDIDLADRVVADDARIDARASA